MRVLFEGKKGTFLGITSTEYVSDVAVIRLDGHGLCLKLVHPSKLLPFPDDALVDELRAEAREWHLKYLERCGASRREAEETLRRGEEDE